MITVIFGAGASAGCARKETSSANFQLKPPLAQELFSKEYKDIRDKYNIEDLSHILDNAAKNEVSIEATLEEENRYPQKKDEMIRLRFYLEELFEKVSDEFLENSGASCYSALIRFFENYAANYLADEIRFITFNYDTLIERAMSRCLENYEFKSIENYYSHDRKYKLIKLHGSCNWKYQIEDQQFWHARKSEMDRLTFGQSRNFESLSNEKIIVVDDIINIGSDDILHYSLPAIGLPITSKDANSFVCPQQMLDKLPSIHYWLEGTGKSF